MANKTKKPANNKQENQAKKPAQKKTVAPAPKVEEPVQTVETPTEVSTPATAGDLVNAMTGHVPGGLDANRRVDLNGQIIKMFHDDPVARQKFGGDICDAMDDIARCGIICALADEAVNGNSTFAAVLKSSQYPALVVAANQMGIKLPALKALPAGETEGTVVVNSTAVEVSDKTKEQLQEEHKVEQAGDKGEIELDPVKIAGMSEDDLIKALQYHMVSGPKKSNPFVMLTTVADFMKKYRMALAEKAENAEEAKASYESRSMYEWLNDAFSFVCPSVLVSGIGKGMAALMLKEASPLSAFLILRQALTDRKTGEVAWSDRDIADATRAIVEFIANNEIKCNEGLLTTLVEDDPNFKKEFDRLTGIIETNKQILGYLNDVSFDIIDGMMSGTSTEVTARGRIWKQYYPDCNPDELPRYKNLIPNIAQRAGIILNLFRAPDNLNQNYSEANLTDIEMYSMEEYLKMKKEKEEQATAAKKEDSKNA